MDPMRLVCDRCGAQLRVANPGRACARPCPCCGHRLDAAIARALNPWAALSTSHVDRPVDDRTSSRGRLGLLVGTAGLLGAASLIHLLSVIVAPMAADLPSPASRVVARPAPTSSIPPQGERPWIGSGSMVDAFEDNAATLPNEEADPSASPAAPIKPDASLPDLALRVAPGAGDALAVVAPPASSTPVSLTPDRPPLPADPRRSGPLNLPPPAPEPAAPVPPAPIHDEPSPSVAPANPAPNERRRFLVRDEAGRTVVAREHGTHDGRVAVVLPDGSIGWPTVEVPTDKPFRPSTAKELEQALGEREYATFRVVSTPHYLVFYQSSERFARDSADLLERLYVRLTQALRAEKLPVTESEFPLIAVIFQTEDDFRANRRVARDVQAYYEILSNRIFFFEKGKGDSASPEVSALRKPQTVAHEGTHQLLHNVGIQPRMSPWPLWLVEGLAEYCSPSKSTKKGAAWAGLGEVNAIHLTTIRDLDDPMSSGVRGGPRAPSNRDRNRPLVEYLATRTELTPTDYALSWGLAHYLAKERIDQFVGYIRRLNRLQPFESRTPEEQLADFRAAFGEDLAKLDAKVGKHLAKLKIPDAQALPYYAVLAQQPGPGGSVRRMAMVSQSPEMIRQWVEGAGAAAGGLLEWQAIAHPNRTRAMLTADDWVHPGR